MHSHYYTKHPEKRAELRGYLRENQYADLEDGELAELMRLEAEQDPDYATVERIDEIYDTVLDRVIESGLVDDIVAEDKPADSERLTTTAVGAAKKGALEFGAEIGGDRDLIPDGDYAAEIVGIERSYYNGGPKLPACWCVNVAFSVAGSVITDRQFLCGEMEWKLVDFFVAIGDAKRGDRFRMDFSEEHLIGKKCTIRVGHAQASSGRVYNSVVKYIAGGVD